MNDPNQQLDILRTTPHVYGLLYSAIQDSAKAVRALKGVPCNACSGNGRVQSSYPHLMMTCPMCLGRKVKP